MSSPSLHNQISRDITKGTLFIAVFIFGLLGIAHYATISGAVMSSGTVVVQDTPRKVQHLTGGKVTQILVRDGDRVNKDQVILKLDDTPFKAKVLDLKTQIQNAKDQIVLSEKTKAVTDRELKQKQEMLERRLTTIVEVNRLDKESIAQATNISRLQGLIGSLSEQLVPAQELLDQAQVRAPISGIIHQLSIYTVGGIVGPQDQLMLIVPDAERLVIEAKIRPEDIDQVYPEQKVRVKFTAFNQKTTPELEGVLNRISPDIVTDKVTNSTYYVGRVDLKDERASEFKIVAGMSAETFINTQDRTILSYFLKPITDQMFKSLRER